MTDPVYQAKKTDALGRCCGRKPMVYRREPHLFCPRCDTAFSFEGEQIQNWAWKTIAGGFTPRHPNADYVKKAILLSAGDGVTP